MSESPLVCPRPTCRKLITPTLASGAAPHACPHCGQSLADTAIRDPQQTVAPGPETDPFATNCAAAVAEPVYVPPEDGVPATIGRFQVRRRLGAGAFGVVYRAYDPELDREVALKVARPNAMLPQESVKAFLREARAAANLRHPSIVPVFDSGMDGDQYFIASAFIPGLTLAQAVRVTNGQGLEPRRAAQIVRQLAEALAYAHKMTVVHRDVKPANVLMGEQGEPFLADFGLARRGEGKAMQSRFPGQPPGDRLAADGTRMTGTPAYMAPEQALGRAGKASDQYSLGVVLFELLTGQLPFAGDIAEHLEQHRSKEPPSPRTLKPKLARDLEAICLKTLAKNPAERYPDCQDLANDLRRWLEGEPIMARKLSLGERLGRWVQKEPKLAAALAAVAVIMTLAIVLLGREQAKTIRAERDRALAQVDALLDISPHEVPNILHSLETSGSVVNARLRELRDQPDLSEPRRTRVSLALLPVNTDEVAYLRRRLFKADPEDLLLIRSALMPYRAQLTAGLWTLARDVQADPDERFRAVAVLAAFDPENVLWASAGQKIVAHFLGSNPLHLGIWMEALRPVRRPLIEPLCEVFRDRDQPELHRPAATVLVDYAADEPELLTELLTEADPGLFALLWPSVQAHRQLAVARLTRVLDGPLPAEDQVLARDALAQRQATAAVALLKLGEAERVWPLLRQTPDPSRRSYLVHLLGRLRAPPEPLLHRLETETDVSARRALILSLGEYTEAQLPVSRRKPLVETVLRWYRDDPDPGIHGAVDWLLRHGKEGPNPRKLDWGQAVALERIDRELAGKPPGERRWYVTRAGHTMTVVPGPVEFQIGSPPYEIGRLEQNEDQVAKRIPRSFAAATKCVTVAQFRRFLEANPQLKDKHTYTAKYSPEDNGPIISVTWFEAAQYCNWLSAREGIAEDQWCYPAIDQIKEGMVLPKDYLHRTGYRLPTEAEWEFVCRAGATSAFSFGCAESLLSEYAWYRKNSHDRTWPVGQLKPNDLGLFDLHGNVWNWCQCRYRDYKAGDDVEDTDTKVAGVQSRSQRGAAFNMGASIARCADRNGNQPSNRSDGVGFLIARTYR